MIIFASFFDTNSHVGTVYSIALTQPSGMDFPRFVPLIPSADIVWGYKAGRISWEEYSTRYLDRLRASEEIVSSLMQDLVGQLLEDHPEGVTFCCWEPDPDHCHRSLAAGFLQEKGFEIELR